MTNTHWIVSTLGLGLALAACGGNDKLTDAAPPVDAPPGPPRAVVVAGDFQPGNPGALSLLDMTSKVVSQKVGPALAVGDDPVLRHFDGELFIVNRSDGNNVTILDDQTLALKEQLGTGTGSNPQDVAVVGTRLYVPAFGGKGVVVVTRGSTAIKEIDLSADDPDGKPNCNSAYRVGNDVYVSCELLDNTGMFLPPRGPGKVYVIDTANDAVKTTLTLTTKNPFGLFEQVPPTAPNAGDLLIPSVDFADGSGCIERIKPGASPSALGCLVTNTGANGLGGYASRIAFQIDGPVAIMWVAIPTTFPKAELRVFDMGTASLWAGALNPTTQVVGDLAFCPTGDTVVSDTTMNVNGLRIYGASTIETTTAVMPVGFVPSSSHGLACY
jgi:hypothetical protein